MASKFFYFGVQRSRIVVDSTGRTRNVPAMVWGRNAYASRKDAIAANISFMENHDDFFVVRGFDYRLDLDEFGVARGYIKEGGAQ